jgi:hypothetical protein
MRGVSFDRIAFDQVSISTRGLPRNGGERCGKVQT